MHTHSLDFIVGNQHAILIVLLYNGLMDLVNTMVERLDNIRYFLHNTIKSPKNKRIHSKDMDLDELH